MKRLLKNNQRKKQLTGQHHKMTLRRQAHFKQVINELFESQASSQVH